MNGDDRIGRRGFALSVALCLACSREKRAAGGGTPAAPVSPNVRSVEYDFGAQPWGRARAVVVVPAWASSETRFPLLVALHGRGEALKAPAEGAMGWPRDYAMVRAIDRLRAPPLTPYDLEGFVEAPHLDEINASLKRRPFGGLVVACPSMPDLDPASSDAVAYARYLVEVLVPRVRRETPSLTAPASTGIDGVSLGGAVALRIGLMHTEVFSAVGGIQPAFGPGESADWTELAQAARARRPDLKLRLLTSRGDYFRDAIFEVSRTWSSRGIDHDFVDVPGPHDVVFNRGPGSIELLMWHDRVLARPS